MGWRVEVSLLCIRCLSKERVDRMTYMQWKDSPNAKWPVRSVSNISYHFRISKAWPSKPFSFFRQASIYCCIVSSRSRTAFSLNTGLRAFLIRECWSSLGVENIPYEPSGKGGRYFFSWPRSRSEYIVFHASSLTYDS
jgi:hypothetical protein